MKKSFISLSMLCALSSPLLALDNKVLDNFETGAISFTEKVNILGGIINKVVDNPSKAGNNSNFAWKFSRVDEESPNWSGMWAQLTEEVPLGYHRIEIKYYRTNPHSQLRIKCEGAVTKEFLPVSPATKVNEWETLTFDLTANGILNVRVFGIQPDFVMPVTPDAEVYVDDITFIYDPTITPPETPSELPLFADSDNNIFFDQSWINVTFPSTVYQAPDHQEKFPVSADVRHEGENALMLKWKSAAGGDWMSLLASIGWQNFNLTEMDNIVMWINSPESLSKNSLPNIDVESFMGGRSGKVAMGNYLTVDLPADTWTEVIIPINDLKMADPAFDSKWAAVKGLFFSQNLADNAEHTLYIDKVSFAKAVDNSLGSLVSGASALKACYQAGILKLNQEVSCITVCNIMGKSVFSNNSRCSEIALDLTSGIYVVSTESGSCKILVP
ncbi:MAG: hypothetical protein ACRCSQ_07750 [Bacteroidales bacterium]